MLVHTEGVRAATNNAALDAVWRYAVARWAELLDPGTHFSRSASSLVDPPTGTREFAETANGLLSGDGTHYSQMFESLRQLGRVIRLDHNLATWYPRNRGLLLREIGHAAAGIPLSWSPAKKEGEMRRRTARLLRVGLQPLQADFTHATDGYRPRLLGQVLDRLHAPPAGDEDWLRFDADLAYLAALALAEGRDPLLLANETAKAFVGARSSAEAASGFESILTRPRADFDVALVLGGARRLRNAAAFGCESFVGRPAWPSGNAAANRTLRQFMRRHTRGNARACGVLVSVRAWDVGQACALALAIAEALQDQVVAEHRLSDVRLRDEVLVHAAADNTVERLRTRRRSVENARTLTPAPIPEIESSLRFYSAAREERQPAVSVLHSWIALEHLAEGAQTQRKNGTWKEQSATTYLPPHVGALMALTGARNHLASLWQLLRESGRSSPANSNRWRQLEVWLGVPPGLVHAKLPAWTALLQHTEAASAPAVLAPDDPQDEAAAFLTDLAERLGPFTERRLREVRWRLNTATELRNWCVTVGSLAALNLVRTKLMRHRVVHRAQHRDVAAQQVAQAGRDILDGVYEVLPKWLPGTSAPWEGFRDARDHFDSLVDEWSSAGPATIDADHLIAP